MVYDVIELSLKGKKKKKNPEQSLTSPLILLIIKMWGPSFIRHVYLVFFSTRGFYISTPLLRSLPLPLPFLHFIHFFILEKVQLGFGGPPFSLYLFLIVLKFQPWRGDHVRCTVSPRRVYGFLGDSVPFFAWPGSNLVQPPNPSDVF